MQMDTRSRKQEDQDKVNCQETEEADRDVAKAFRRSSISYTQDRAEEEIEGGIAQTFCRSNISHDQSQDGVEIRVQKGTMPQKKKRAREANCSRWT